MLHRKLRAVTDVGRLVTEAVGPEIFFLTDYIHVF
jgi:hypothetical protein